jgi:general secretion pathway protein G
MWKWLAALTAVALAATLVAIQAFGSADHSDLDSQRLRAQLELLAGTIDQFEKDTGALPRSLDELLVEPSDGNGPYTKSGTLLDPWGAPIYYRHIAPPQRFVVISLGQDGMLGGTGNARDRQATGLKDGH